MIKSENDLRMGRDIQTAIGKVVTKFRQAKQHKGLKVSIDYLWAMARECHPSELAWYKHKNTFKGYILHESIAKYADGPKYFYDLFIGDDDMVRLVDNSTPSSGYEAAEFVKNMRSIGATCAFCGIEEEADIRRYMDQGESRGPWMHSSCRATSHYWSWAASEYHRVTQQVEA